MNGSLFESVLIEHCAPTLAGMKAASLFNYFFEEKEIVLEEIRNVNEALNERGVYIEVLRWKNGSALIYAYRPKCLQEKLGHTETMDLLIKYGYTDCDIEKCICHLKRRLYDYKCFPHEIGVFLDYPLEDVKGFIENKGQNCQSCGLWKVYCNEVEKEKLFEKFIKCKKIYIQVFGEGRELSQMTVFT